MNYEEKYNEILEWARKNKARLNGVPIEEVLPELCESEDERIRKVLIRIVKGACSKYGVKYRGDEITEEILLSYLEKQKEQKPADNPKWAELTWKDINELERIINNVHYEFQNGIGEDSFGELVLERFREYKDEGFMDEQKPAEWSEEEIIYWNTIKDYFFGIPLDDKLKSALDWFKSLRPSWKPSEDEERLIKTSISFLKDFADKGYESAVECIYWLKSKLNGNSCK